MKTIYTLVVFGLLMVGSANAQLNINFTGTTGYPITPGELGVYSSPFTSGAQLKAAYPGISPNSVISSWYRSSSTAGQDLEIIDVAGTNGNCLILKTNSDYIEFGPCSFGYFNFDAVKASANTKVEVIIYSGTPGSGNSVFNFSYNLNSTSWSTIRPSTPIPLNGYFRIIADQSDDIYIDNISLDATPLPVELTSFRSYLRDDLVELQWNTATELNNYGFEVERSVNGDDWSVLGFVEGHGTSFVPQQYSFRDAQLDRSSTELYYRLKQMDRDGTTEYSDVLRVALAAPTSVSLNAYPQPFAGSLNIDLAVTSSEQVRITLYNSAMQKVKSVYEGTVDGNMSMVVPTSDLRDGSYFLIVNHSDGETQVQKLLHMQSR